MRASLLALLLAVPAGALTPFVDQLRRAESRDAKDPERVEFASRALRAWLPSDGRLLRAQAHFLRAEGEAELYNDPAAEEDLTKALEVDGNNQRAKLMRAVARARLGRGVEAERDASDYLLDKPEDPEGWLALGEARLAQGRPKADREARTAFSKAAALLGPDDPRPSLGDGRSYLALSRHGDALASLSSAAEHPQKRRADILSLRSRAYSALGNWKAARNDLDVALPDLERALEDRRRSGASQRGIDIARKSLADGYFRRGLSHEALDLLAAALNDHHQACGLGLAAACARVDALEKRPRQASPPAPRAATRRKNPKGGAGERIYAN